MIFLILGLGVIQCEVYSILYAQLIIINLKRLIKYLSIIAIVDTHLHSMLITVEIRTDQIGYGQIQHSIRYSITSKILIYVD